MVNSFSFFFFFSTPDNQNEGKNISQGANDNQSHKTIFQVIESANREKECIVYVTGNQ